MALDYEAPKDRIEREPAVPVIELAFVFLGCFAAGAAVVLGVGVVVFLALESHVPAQFAMALIWCVIALIFLIMFFRTSVRNRARLRLRVVARWAWLGFLLGIGVTCLIEGCCFALSS